MGANSLLLLSQFYLTTANTEKASERLTRAVHALAPLGSLTRFKTVPYRFVELTTKYLGATYSIQLSYGCKFLSNCMVINLWQHVKRSQTSVIAICDN
jgi:hypothetical protein